ncbi:MAG: ABC transporter permease [Chloroflexia bacterium]|nr:ABC transporter permease [Chloroflexia bacterium]
MTQRVDIAPAGSTGSVHAGRLTTPVDAETPGAGASAAPRVGPGAAPGLDFRFRQQRSLWGNAWRQFRRHKLAMFGLVVFVAMLLATFLGTPLYPQEIDTIDFSVSGGSLTWQHPFGTDSLGRDMLARILWGGRISLAVGMIAALVAILVGTTVGAVAGFFGGAADTVLMRLTDLFISLPQIPLLLVVSFLYRDAFFGIFQRRFGSGVLGVFVLIVLVIGLLSWMPTARLVRASFLSTREKEFVEAARSIGTTRLSQMFKHILPNVVSPIIVAATLGIGAAIITESALSFLGLGFPSDVPTWGSMLYEAKDRFSIAPHEAIFPGLMIFLTVLAINYIGDGLRDALDPRKSQ